MRAKHLAKQLGEQKKALAKCDKDAQGAQRELARQQAAVEEANRKLRELNFSEAGAAQAEGARDAAAAAVRSAREEVQRLSHEVAGVRATCECRQCICWCLPSVWAAPAAAFACCFGGNLSACNVWLQDVSWVLWAPGTCSPPAGCVASDLQLFSGLFSVQAVHYCSLNVLRRCDLVRAVCDFRFAHPGGRFDANKVCHHRTDHSSCCCCCSLLLYPPDAMSQVARATSQGQWPSCPSFIDWCIIPALAIYLNRYV